MSKTKFYLYVKFKKVPGWPAHDLIEVDEDEMTCWGSGEDWIRLKLNYYLVEWENLVAEYKLIKGQTLKEDLIEKLEIEYYK